MVQDSEQLSYICINFSSVLKLRKIYAGLSVFFFVQPCLVPLIKKMQLKGAQKCMELRRDKTAVPPRL